MQRLTKCSKIIFVAILCACFAAGAAFAGSNYEYGGQYAYDGVSGATSVSGPITGVVCDLSDPYFQETYAAYFADSDYGWNTADNAVVLETTTASSSAVKSTGVICDLSVPYFQETYAAQFADSDYGQLR